MKIKQGFVFGIAAALTIGAGIAIGASINRGEPFRSFSVAPRSAKGPVDLSTANITRRIYFINNDDYWAENWTKEDMQHLVVSAAKSTDHSCGTDAPVPATLLMSDVRNGLYYADVAFPGAGHELIVTIAVDSNYSGASADPFVIPALTSSLADVLYLNSGLIDGHRMVSGGTFNELSEGMASYLLSQYKTCSDSYADGFNAYPQLIKDFSNIPFVAQSTEVTDYTYASYVDNGYDYEGLTPVSGATTIGAKLAGMQTNFNANGWSIPDGNLINFNFSNAPYVCTPITNGQNITYSGVKDGSWANVYSWIGKAPANAKGVTIDFFNDGEDTVKISIGFGTGNPFESHIASGAYDYYDSGAGRANFDIGAHSPRSLTLEFDEAAVAAEQIDGVLLFLDSIREASETTRSGDVTIKNAVYFF